MDINKLFFYENEKPLDTLCSDGGFVGIFRTIACIGDSLSSGEFQVKSADGNDAWMYLDRFDYSWGQYLGRMAGCKVYNFSRGGMKAVEYRQSFANHMGYWNPALAANAYVIALGVNDIYGRNLPIGAMDDICFDDYEKNADTYIGNYAYIIQRYRTIAPDAPFFLVTTPKRSSEPFISQGKAMADAIHAIAGAFDNCYVVDLYAHLPHFEDEMKNALYLNGHMNAAGYLLMAKIIGSYMDYIIRHNIEKFKTVGLDGVDYDRSKI